jgi:hypothetical protein
VNQFPFKPEPIDVVTTEGKPSRVMFKKRFQKVKEICNLWRIDDGWWFKPVSRMYYTLELESGSRVTVFCDLSDNKWYRQNWTN